MELDVRLPMGAMFVVLGVVVLAAGLKNDEADLAKSLGVHINLWWGTIMCAVGLIMLTLVWRARVRAKRVA